ncbi:MAG: type II toxin-antitoxin system YafQ family toxin [Eubacterium sp.]|nr:type II toxin-antitoxin system YafQ family toxin [Eubacterium sp.]
MLKVSSTTKFNKDLPLQNKDHDLKGNFAGKRECHIAPDWLLIYRIENDE